MSNICDKKPSERIGVEPFTSQREFVTIDGRQVGYSLTKPESQTVRDWLVSAFEEIDEQFTEAHQHICT